MILISFVSIFHIEKRIFTSNFLCTHGTNKKINKTSDIIQLKEKIHFHYVYTTYFLTAIQYKRFSLQFFALVIEGVCSNHLVLFEYEYALHIFTFILTIVITFFFSFCFSMNHYLKKREKSIYNMPFCTSVKKVLK